MVAQQLTVARPASTPHESTLLLELLASGLTLPEFLETLPAEPALRNDPLARRSPGHSDRPTLAPVAAAPSAPQPSQDPAHWYRATAPLWDAIDRAWPASAEQAA